MATLPTGIVTFLYTDLEGSARRWEAHPAAMRAAVDRRLALLRAAVAEHRGVVVRSVGDGLCAASRRSRPRLTGATTCSLSRNKGCSGGWRCAPAASHSRRRKR